MSCEVLFRRRGNFYTRFGNGEIDSSLASFHDFWFGYELLFLEHFRLDHVII